MNNALNSMKNNNLKESHLLNAGLSISNQSLHETDEFGVREEGIPRSGSLPDITKTQSEFPESWQTGNTTKASHCLNKYGNLDEEMSLSDFRELVIYEPIEEVEEEDKDDGHNGVNESHKLSECNSVNAIKKQKSRKRDSAALFDITLGDLTEPDFAGLLMEKHSEKLWFCVLIDQHLCIFPSQDPDEVAYDVVIMPCCQISLDDRLMRTPVFRLTQSGMSPWVFVASNNDELKEWMKVLTIAASAGKHNKSQASSVENHSSSRAHLQPPQMQSIDEEVEEEEVETVEENQVKKSLPVPSSFPAINFVATQSPTSSLSSLHKKTEGEQTVEYVNAEAAEMSFEGEEEPPELPKRPDQIDGEPFGEIYEAVGTILQPGKEEFEDDGFATDEFDSGSSDGGDAPPNPQSLPVQQKAKKKKQFFHWLKKKAKKDKLFSSPQDGVALAGYAYKSTVNCKRWFLVREEKLHCFKTIKDDDPEITVDLNVSEVKAGEEEKSKLAIHVIKAGVIAFTLIAKSAKDWERWKKALLLESGFIKLAVSPTDKTPEVYGQEDEEDYITPIIPPGLEKSPLFETPDSGSHPDRQQGLGDDNEDDLYMEVVPVAKEGQLGPMHQQEFGPLPAIPPELPPRKTPDGAEKKDARDSGLDSGKFEIYEEVSSTLPHADKVVKWEGLNGSLENVVSQTEVQNEEGEKGSKGEDVSKSGKGPIPAGIADGSIDDSAFTASSFLDSSFRPCSGRLNNMNEAWCAKVNDKQQYLQIDLGDVTKVCGIASQGRAGFTDEGGWFVKTYTLAHSKDGENWVNYKEFGIAKVFQANSDPDTTVTNMLKMVVNARYIRLKPQSWHNHIALRVEIYKGEPSSKLTSGIHKLADSLSKAGKGKPFDKQTTSPTTTADEVDAEPASSKPLLARKVSFDKEVKYIDRPSSVENLVEDVKAKKEENGQDDKDNSDMESDGYLEILREASKEEKEVETRVQQKIDERRREEGAHQVGKHEVSQGILAKKNLYEQKQQSGTNAELEVKKHPGPKTRKEFVLQSRKEVISRKDENTPKAENGPCNIQHSGRKDTESFDPDKEREDLEKTEQAFQDYAKQLKEQGGAVVREKRGSIVALNRLNFEDPRDGTKNSKENLNNRTKAESIMKEKEELLKRLEVLKRRINVAKDRKIFFSLSTNRSQATADADAEFHESQLELAKTKKRLLEIENETKNLKLLELRYQKSPEKGQASPAKKPLVRKSSRECKLGPGEFLSTKVESCASAGSSQEQAHKGSVLSQIKVFEKMKEQK